MSATASSGLSTASATASSLVLFSEAILSLYPILIKVVPTSLTTQWFVRFLTFPVLAYLLSSTKDVPRWSLTMALAGLLNLVHIGTSYLSFSILPAGIALSLFYLYPIFNVIAGSIFFGEPLQPLSIFLLLLALVGVYLLSYEPFSEESSVPTSAPTSSYTLGVVCAIVAAITETLLYVFVRWNKKASVSPYSAILQLYPVGLLVILFYLTLQPASLDTNPQHLLWLIGFNIFVGFVGYAIRFYTIPKVPTLVFSLLSFVGVVFGYLWGHWFTADKIQPLAWIGSSLIVLSTFLVRITGSKDS